MTVFGYGSASGCHSLAAQLEQLHASGCKKIYLEKTGEAIGNYSQLTACLDTVREGDQVVFYNLEQITKSIKQLQQVLSLLKKRKVVFRDLSCRSRLNSLDGRLYRSVPAYNH